MAPKHPTNTEYQKLRKDVDMLLEDLHDRQQYKKNLAQFEANEYKEKKRKIAGWAGTGLIVLVLLIQMIIQFLASRK